MTPAFAALLHGRHLATIALHAGLLLVGYLLAYELRFDFALAEEERSQLRGTLGYLIAARLLVFERYNLFRGRWRDVGVTDLANIVKAVTFGSLLFVALLFWMQRTAGMPRSVFVLEWMLALLLVGGVRFATRYHREGRLAFGPSKGKRAFVIGAGAAGELLLRQFQHDDYSEVNVVGLIDDDPATHRAALHGVPVLGTMEDMQWLAMRDRIELLIIAIPSATGEQMQRIVARCRATGIAFKVVPSFQELLEGNVKLGQLRDVQIEDLLAREPVKLDLRAVEEELRGEVVLITGGAGSIGSELARQVARFRPRKLVLLEQAESPLYFVHLDLVRENPGVEIVPAIGDITNVERLEQVFAAHEPAFVFHAAAYKHVPMMEANVVEAVRNNVLGTLRVADCAARHDVRKFVLISSDKAVNPTSVMGATKRLAECIVLGWPSLRRSGTDFRSVRFGNVLGSDGSVIPLFKRQLAGGGPITVTHRDVTRFFMMIPEAVQLVLQSTALPEAAGRILMLQMGQSVRIADLAEQLVTLSGLRPHHDIQIVYTGLRPGEKLHEELTSELETYVPTAVDKIQVVQTAEVDGAAIETGVRRLATLAERGRPVDLVREIAQLLPEFRSWLLERGAPVADREVPLGDLPPGRPVAIPADAVGVPSVHLEAAAPASV